jgi:hypothetical protein
MEGAERMPVSVARELWVLVSGVCSGILLCDGAVVVVKMGMMRNSHIFRIVVMMWVEMWVRVGVGM